MAFISSLQKEKLCREHTQKDYKTIIVQHKFAKPTSGDMLKWLLGL